MKKIARIFQTIKLEGDRAIKKTLPLLTISIALSLLVSTFYGTLFLKETDKQHRKTVEEQFKITLNKILRLSETGDPSKLLTELYKISPRNLTAESKYKWLLTIGQLHYRKALLNPELRDERELSLAREYFHKALRSKPKEISPFAPYYHLIKTAQTNNLPHRALRLMDQINLDAVEPDEKNILLYHKALSHIEIREERQAITSLAEAISNLDGQFSTQGKDNHINVLMLQTDLKLKNVRTHFRVNKHKLDLELPKTLSESLKDGRQLLLRTIPKMEKSDPRNAPVLNALIELDLISNEIKDAYKKIKKIDRMALTSADKVRSLMLLSMLEERNGDFIGAIKPLQLALRDYPFDSQRQGAFKRMFNLYSRRQNWKEALEIMNRWAGFVTSRIQANEIIDEFLPHQSNFINELQKMSNNATSYTETKDAKEYLTQSSSILAKLRKKLSPRWLSLQEKSLFLLGYTSYLSGGHKKSESYLSDYIENNKDGDFIEEALYYDMLCAIALKHPAPVQDYRTQRYLSRYPEGREEYRKTALENRLDILFQMKLYRETIEVAKVAFVDQLLSLGKDQAILNEKRFLTTLSKIASCYYNIDNYNLANSIFKKIANRIKDIDPPVEICLEWADSSVKLDQIPEGIRRLQVSERIKVDPYDQRRLSVAQDLLHLKRGKKPDIPKVIKKINDLKALAKPEKYSKKEIEQQVSLIHQQLVEELFNLSPDFSLEALKELSNDYKDKTWFTIWSLKALNTSLRKSGPTPELRKKFNDLIQALPKEERSLRNIGNQLDYFKTIAEIDGNIKDLKQRGLK